VYSLVERLRGGVIDEGGPKHLKKKVRGKRIDEAPARKGDMGE